MRLSLLLLLILPGFLSGQARERLEEARARYELGDYPATIRTLRADEALIRNEPEAALLLSVSLFHANALTESRAVLDELIERRGDNFPVARFYLGRLYHAQNLFSEAAAEYKRYLRTLRQGGEAWRTVTALLRNVDNAIRQGYGEQGVVVDNLGPGVNTAADEFGPIPSPSGAGRVYYTALQPGRRVGSGDTDIYFTKATGATWAKGATLNELLNTGANEALVDISRNGSKLYYFRGEGVAGRYLVDTFRTDARGGLATVPLDAPLSADHEDVTPFFGASDALYFASNRPGGYGGLDLYRRDRLADGGYGPAQNLGPQVNGPYDEICPFVANDGRTLYLSTNDPAVSIGGFDVVRSFRVVGGGGRYTLPEGVGVPVNSPSDDTYFRLAPDTFTAFLASDRKDGFGQRDIYVVYYPAARPEMQ